MARRRFFIIFIFPIFFAVSGCAKLAHMQELLTLKGYSDEAAAQGRYVAAQDKKFDRMRTAVQDGTIKKYSQGRSFLRAFGDPVYIRPVTRNGVACSEWLYRYAQGYTNSDKVYLYLDAEDKLLDLNYVPAEK